MAADLQLLITVDPDEIAEGVNEILGNDNEDNLSIRKWVEDNMDSLNRVVQEALINEIAGEPF